DRTAATARWRVLVGPAGRCPSAPIGDARRRALADGAVGPDSLSQRSTGTLRRSQARHAAASVARVERTRSASPATSAGERSPARRARSVDSRKATSVLVSSRICCSSRWCRSPAAERAVGGTTARVAVPATPRLLHGSYLRRVAPPGRVSAEWLPPPAPRPAREAARTPGHGATAPSTG